jgi:hypothetical protein
MLPNSRDELKEYCLRRLGHPVLQINVDNQQLEDRMDDVIDYFHQFHFDGVEQIYLKHKITASVLKFAAPPTSNPTGLFFKNSDKIVGQTSGAKGTVVDQAENDLSIRFVHDNNNTSEFVPGEVITTGQTTVSATLSSASDFMTYGDWDNKWIPCEAPVLSVIRVLPLRSSPLNMFDVRYQFALNNMPNLLGMDLISYRMYQQHLSLLHELFYGEKHLRHNKKMGRIYLDIDWVADVMVDHYVVLDCWRALDPNQYPLIFQDYWVREYCTVLFKKQWATNMLKFKDIELLAGVKLNPEKMLDDAVKEQEALEERIHKEFQLPVDMFIG